MARRKGTENTTKTPQSGTKPTPVADKPNARSRTATRAVTQTTRSTTGSDAVATAKRTSRLPGSQPGRTRQGAARSSAVAPISSAAIARGFTDDEIRARAYQIYLRRGGRPGDPVADWLQAERELRELHALT